MTPWTTRRRHARFAAFFVGTIGMGVADAARADEPAAEAGPGCDAAFEAADMHLRPSEGRLLDARAALRLCARPSCNGWMVDDCSKRLVEVEGRIPSVVFSARDGGGAPLNDVRVLEGSRELLERLDGRAIELDPGPHELVAERGGARVPLSVVVIEGKKAQQVVFAFHDAVGPTSAATSSRDPSPLAHPWGRPLAAGLLAGAVVASGIGVGLVTAAVNQKEDARCDADNVCDDGRALDRARDAARAASVSFVVAGALAVGGAVTFLVFGRAHVQASARLNFLQFAIKW